MKILKTKKYVGSANTLADSRIPRRFIVMMRPMMRMQLVTLKSLSQGNAEAMFSIPDATDTETVRM